MNRLILAVGAASLWSSLAPSLAACSSPDTITLTIPRRDLVAPAADVAFPAGVAVGGTCEGAVYFAVLDGWALCVKDKWTYTKTNPTTFGDYTLDPEYDSFEPTAVSSSGSSQSGASSGSSRHAGSTSSTPTSRTTSGATGTVTFTVQGQGQG